MKAHGIFGLYTIDVESSFSIKASRGRAGAVRKDPRIRPSNKKSSAAVSERLGLMIASYASALVENAQ
jgi:hypothetical protein